MKMKALLALSALPLLAAASLAPCRAAGKASAPVQAAATAQQKPIPPCGPEVVAVLGGEDETACLPHDIGSHGSATVRLGVTGKSPASKPSKS